MGRGTMKDIEFKKYNDLTEKELLLAKKRYLGNVKDFCVVCEKKMEIDLERYWWRGNSCFQCLIKAKK